MILVINKNSSEEEIAKIGNRIIRLIDGQIVSN